MSEQDSCPPLPTLLDVERAISELRYSLTKMQERTDVDPWMVERALSIDRVLAWLELELGPLVAEFGVPLAEQASQTEVPTAKSIRRVLLERIDAMGPRRDFTPSDLGELGTRVVLDVPQGFVPDRNAMGEPMVFTNRGDVAVTFSGGVVGWAPRDGTVAPPAAELVERMHELGEVTPEEGRTISGGECSGEPSCTCVVCLAVGR